MCIIRSSEDYPFLRGMQSNKNISRLKNDGLVAKLVRGTKSYYMRNCSSMGTLYPAEVKKRTREILPISEDVRGKRAKIMN